MRRYCLLACLVVALLVSLPAATGLASVVRFKLNDHPDGNQNPPSYGIRLDDIITFSGISTDADEGVMTISFDSLNNAFLDYDMSTGEITIHGTAIGGSDNISSLPSTDPPYIDNDLWGKYEFKMVYDSSSSSTVSGETTIKVEESPDGLGEGYVKMIDFLGTMNATSPFDGETIPLTGKANGNGLVFELTQKTHRLGGYPQENDPTVWEGFGWINNAAMDAEETNDFLFIAQVVPEPSGFIVWSLILMGVCISGKQISRFQRTSRSGT